jgi:predicted MFS family arabinose efflux permease
MPCSKGTLFNEKERGRAIGTWSGFTAITTAFGPVLGGWLVQHASWRWVFFVNAPLAVVVLILTLWRVPESRDETAAARLDWAGALLAMLGLGGVVYGLITSSSLGIGNPQVFGVLIAGALALMAFVAVEARLRAPMMPLGLFRSRTFSGANLLTLLLYGALGATIFFVPFDLIQAQGYSPTAAGAAFLSFVLIMFGLSRWSGGLVVRYGAKLPLIAGPTMAAAGFALFARPDLGGSYWTTFFPAVVVLGLGMAITVAPLTTAVMSAVETRHSGLASGINNAVSRTAGLLAIAVLGIVMLAAFSGSLGNDLAALHVSSATRHLLDTQRTRLAAAQVPAGIGGAQRVALEHAIAQSFVAGFRAVMLIDAALASASALSAAALVGGKDLRLGKSV